MKALNLGCGPNWQKDYPNYEGLDILDYGQKYITDVLDFFCGGVPKVQFVNQFDEVMAYHFLEHFNQNDLKSIIRGVWEILKDGGVFKFIVPHMIKDRSWILSHKTFWNMETAKWLESDEANAVYGFGKWKIKELVTNDRHDIYACLIKNI